MNDKTNEVAVDDTNLDLTERTQIYTIGGERYILVEASGEAGCNYKNAAAKAVKMDNKGRPTGIGDIASARPILVAGCLFKLVDDNRVPVALEVIKSWSDRIQQKLFDKAQELSGMNDEETGKNS